MNKKKYAKLDERGMVRFSMFETDAEAAEQGFLPYEETEMPASPANVIPHNYSPEYIEQNGKIIKRWKAYPNYEEIERLEKKLASSDYKIIKCYEASLVGAKMPYDTEELHQARQKIRDEINRLEACE